MRNTIIGNALSQAGAGSRIKGVVPIGRMASGAAIAIPYVALKGARDGPCLWINGQVHGVEINGIIAALDLVRELDPHSISGNIVVTGTANPLAFDARRKTAPQDEIDLDQTFPGHPEGFIAERMADALFREVRPVASTLINMHTNSPAFEGRPYSVYKHHSDGGITERVLLKLMAPFRPAVSCLMSIEPGRGELPGNIAGALDYRLLGLGIPAFMIELGGGSRAEAQYIKQGIAGMRGVAQQMGLLEASGDDHELPKVLRKVTRRAHLRFNEGGLFRACRHAGDEVKAGEQIGEVMNLHGEIVERMILSYDVVIIAIRSEPVVHTGDRFIFVAQAWQDVSLS